LENAPAVRAVDTFHDGEAARVRGRLVPDDWAVTFASSWESTVLRVFVCLIEATSSLSASFAEESCITAFDKDPSVSAGPDSESSVGGVGIVISFIGYTYKGLLSNSVLEVFLWAHNLEKQGYAIGKLGNGVAVVDEQRSCLGWCLYHTVVTGNG